MQNQLDEMIVTLRGNNTSSLRSSQQITDILRSNLGRKRVGIKDLLMKNTGIPSFIPDMLSAKNAGYVCTATSTTYAGNTPSTNSTDYFVVIRNNANTVAAVSFVQWASGNPNATTAPTYVPTNEQAKTLPYYYCFDINFLLRRVSTAIDVAIASAIGGGYTGTLILYDPATNSFDLCIKETVNFALIGGYTMEFSQSLIKLFPFESSAFLGDGGNLPTALIHSAPIKRTINGVSYHDFNCGVVDFAPFDLFLLGTNLPISGVEFVTNYGTNDIKKTMFSFRRIGQGFDFGTLMVSNDYLSDKLHYFEQDSFSDVVSFNLTLRQKDTLQFVPWSFGPDFVLDMTLYVYTLLG